MQKDAFIFTASLLVGTLGPCLVPLQAGAQPASPTGQMTTLISTLLSARAAAPSASSSSGAQPQINAVVNAGSFTSAVSPGALISIFTSNTPFPFTIGAGSTPLPTGLNGATVSINGKPLPLLYVAPSNATTSGQINAQLPYEVGPGNTSAILQMNIAGTITQTPAFPFTVASASPGIFSFSIGQYDGKNHPLRAVVQNADGSLNNFDNPAAAGSYVVLYLTGGGPIDNPVPSGSPAPLSPLSRATGAFSATIEGQDAPVVFLGLTPTFVGLFQANIQVPNTLPAGDHSVILTINGITSNNPVITTK